LNTDPETAHDAVHSAKCHPTAHNTKNIY
jgi:hypothetical protein